MGATTRRRRTRRWSQTSSTSACTCRKPALRPDGHMGQNSRRNGIGADVRTALEAKGHKLRDGRGQMGGYQAVFIDPKTGVLLGGSDLRKDGLAIGW